jgi:hypothetical protein
MAIWKILQLVIKTPSLTQLSDFKGLAPLIDSTTSSPLPYERPGCPFSGPSAGRLATLLASEFHGN